MDVCITNVQNAWTQVSAYTRYRVAGVRHCPSLLLLVDALLLLLLLSASRSVQAESKREWKAYARRTAAILLFSLLAVADFVRTRLNKRSSSRGRTRIFLTFLPSLYEALRLRSASSTRATRRSSCNTCNIFGNTLARRGETQYRRFATYQSNGGEGWTTLPS